MQILPSTWSLIRKEVQVALTQDSFFLYETVSIKQLSAVIRGSYSTVGGLHVHTLYMYVETWTTQPYMDLPQTVAGKVGWIQVSRMFVYAAELRF